MTTINLRSNLSPTRLFVAIGIDLEHQIKTLPSVNGDPTGQCVEFNSSVKTCKVFAWCPIEGMRNASKIAVLESAENFTVFIKNKIGFINFNFTKFARYYKQNRVEERTLFKVHGIRFDVMVTGKTIIVVDILLTNYIPCCGCKKEDKSFYTGKKYEVVKADQTKSPLCISFVDEDHIEVVKGPVKKSLQEMKSASTQVRRLNNESMRECLSFLQRPPSRSEDIEMQEERQTGVSSKEHETPPWCRCGQCRPMTSLKEELCCRRSAGQCISTSATFSRLVLDRQTLESVLLYRKPLLDLQAHASTKWLRHCTYHQYTHWRFGDVETDSCAVIPSCSVWKIRERYPSVEGQYTGLCCEKREQGHLKRTCPKLQTEAGISIISGDGEAARVVRRAEVEEPPRPEPQPQRKRPNQGLQRRPTQRRGCTLQSSKRKLKKRTSPAAADLAAGEKESVWGPITVSHDSDVGSQPSTVVEPSTGSEGQEKGGPQPADLVSEDPVLEGSGVGGDSLGAQVGPVGVPPSDETPQPAGSVVEMPAADGDSAGEEEDGSAGSDEE
ncbi:UNVERIFIED_CONTAM: hypothetical protein FKN15_074160 [Acipenser sinensis]